MNIILRKKKDNTYNKGVDSVHKKVINRKRVLKTGTLFVKGMIKSVGNMLTSIMDFHRLGK
jgi:transposase